MPSQSRYPQLRLPVPRELWVCTTLAPPSDCHHTKTLTGWSPQQETAVWPMDCVEREKLIFSLILVSVFEDVEMLNMSNYMIVG